MSVRIKILIVVGVVPLFLANAWAMDWKPIHEKADRDKYETLLLESKKDLGSLGAQYALALSCLNLYKISEARVVFEKMLALDPESQEARWGLAELARRHHKSDKAKKRPGRYYSEKSRLRSCLYNVGVY